MRPGLTVTRMPIKWLLLAAAFVVAAPSTAVAYVGPGAGFAFVSSIFIIVFTTFLAFLTLLTWPIRWVVQRIRGSHALAAARVRQVVVLGLDGQDPELTEEFMNEGRLPNFARLREHGTFVPLRTTLLAESACGVDVVSDRLQPRQAPNLRLPGAQPKIPSPRALFGPGRPSEAHTPVGTVSDSSRQAGDPDRSSQPAVLEDAGGPRYLQPPFCVSRSRFRLRSSTASCFRR